MPSVKKNALANSGNPDETPHDAANSVDPDETPHDAASYAGLNGDNTTACQNDPCTPLKRTIKLLVVFAPRPVFVTLKLASEPIEQIRGANTKYVPERQQMKISFFRPFLSY
ncbi:hypothetical protein DPMN_045326 [Dreissena polymorpha]|uniref:Uncharacterized protein n=1 Tax=Dreissena polymorpha TaxID=45954 RepID=A0A9D4I1A7_DREPO|nr:hypothetical protein DPMN_045326 [Dreissena polymorpha]